MKVYVAFESAVYHVDRDCAGLRRHGQRASTEVAERLEDGSMFYTGGFHAGQRLRGTRRACAVCARTDASTREQK